MKYLTAEENDTLQQLRLIVSQGANTQIGAARAVDALDAFARELNAARATIAAVRAEVAPLLEPDYAPTGEDGRALIQKLAALLDAHDIVEGG